jgi:hypothetical protein
MTAISVPFSNADRSLPKLPPPADIASGQKVTQEGKIIERQNAVTESENRQVARIRIVNATPCKPVTGRCRRTDREMPRRIRPAPMFPGERAMGLQMGLQTEVVE